MVSCTFLNKCWIQRPTQRAKSDTNPGIIRFSTSRYFTFQLAFNIINSSLNLKSTLFVQWDITIIIYFARISGHRRFGLINSALYGRIIDTKEMGQPETTAPSTLGNTTDLDLSIGVELRPNIVEIARKISPVAGYLVICNFRGRPNMSGGSLFLFWWRMIHFLPLILPKCATNSIS